MKMRKIVLTVSALLMLCLLAAGCGQAESGNDLKAAGELLEREAVQSQRPEWMPQEPESIAYAEDGSIAAGIYAAGDERYVVCCDSTGAISFMSFSQEGQGLACYDDLAFYANSTRAFCFYDRTEGVCLASVPGYENRLFRAHGLTEKTPLLLSSTMEDFEGVLWFSANESDEADASSTQRDTTYEDVIAYDTATEALTLIQKHAQNPFFYTLDESDNRSADENPLWVLKSDDKDGFRFYSGAAQIGEVSAATLPAATDGGHWACHYQVGTQREGTYRIVMMVFDYRPEQAVPLAADYVEEAYDMKTTWQCVVMDEDCQITKCFDTGIPVVWANTLSESPAGYDNATLYFNAIEGDVLYTLAVLPQEGGLVESHWAVSLADGVNTVSRIN